jgi:hypothetical protein
MSKERCPDAIGYYCICLHVINQGHPVASVYPPDESNEFVGSIVCGLKKANDHTVDELTLLCNVCCEEKGLAKVGARIAPKKRRKPW